MKTAIVIGSGFSGLSTASYLAKSGWDVTVFEKHDLPGGRARKFEANGFIFDMGPSWYWMPGVFERYFENFGRKRSDYYSLTRLDPSYKVFWSDSEISIPANYDELKNLFETIEKGSSKKLDQYLSQAEYKYKVGIDKLVHKPGRSLTEFLDWDLIKGLFKLDVFSSIKNHIEKNFESPKLRQLLEFPVLFLGALPKDTPALYSLMNYADIIGGTWYPENGMYSVVEGMYKLAAELGVKFRFKENVTGIDVSKKKTTGVTTQTGMYKSDVVIASADYHFVDNELLPQDKRNYSEEYWDERVLAPSCLLYFIGVGKKIKNIMHHSLFFDVDFDKHGDEIYISKKWPEKPLFYVSATSVTDNKVAPEGCENLFFLIPVAAGLTGDDDDQREKYFEKIIARFEKRIGENIQDDIIYKKCFGPSDFVKDYNAYKGNAYGLANTLMQTAVLKPSCRSKKMDNLFYTGQLTVPGPGVPPSLISGEVVAGEVIKHFGS